MSDDASPQTGDEAPASLTWTVGAVTRETPVGFLGVTLVPNLFVSDAVFDGLRDRLLQLGPINPGAMYVQSDTPDAALEAIERLYKATVGGNFSYYSCCGYAQRGKFVDPSSVSMKIKRARYTYAHDRQARKPRRLLFAGLFQVKSS